MILKNLHTHTVFSDGKNTPEEMVEQAIKLNMECIGFSDHSYTPFDAHYCMPENKIGEYKEEINRLKEKYKGKIEILCGIEQDFYSTVPTDDYDYVIGSVHYLKFNDEYMAIDHTAEILKETAGKHFGEDYYALAERYFETVSDVVEKTNADIIGHFDLITKFNEKVILFDENNERYVKAYKTAIDKLVKYGKPFEINTGAISRGYRTSAYPNNAMLEYIYKKGGKVILSSDAHSKENILFDFEKQELNAKKTGFEF